jgi:hypothetical protein
MEAGVPYANAALSQLLANQSMVVTGACNADTAIAMAEAARIRAIELLLMDEKRFSCLANNNVFGISCTAALVSNTPKKGAHRCHVGISSSTQKYVLSLSLEKGLRSRVEEDYVCSRLAIDALADICSVAKPTSNYLREKENDALEDREDTEVISKSVYPIEDVFTKLENRAIKNALFVYKHEHEMNSFDRETVSDISDQYSIHENVIFPERSMIYSGSFNPLHEGHISLVKAALKVNMDSEHHLDLNSDSSDSYEQPLIVFEISLLNADKPPLARQDIITRIHQFKMQNELLKKSGLNNFAVCVTTEPFFLGKSKIFPRCDFILGIDTMTRLLNPKYYGYSELSMISVMTSIKDNGIRFFVGGRAIIPPEDAMKKKELSESSTPDSKFITLFDFLQSLECKSLPENIKEMFLGLSEEQFRVDLSSTEIRLRSK